MFDFIQHPIKWSLTAGVSLTSGYVFFKTWKYFLRYDGATNAEIRKELWSRLASMEREIIQLRKEIKDNNEKCSKQVSDLKDANKMLSLDKVNLTIKNRDLELRRAALEAKLAQQE